MPLSGGKWHPKDKSTVITWSLDGTARYWDIEEQECTDVIKAKPRAAERQQVTSAALSNQLSKLTLGCRDGSIQVFDCNSSLRRPKVHIKLAHEPMVGISDLLFEPASDVSLYSRGGDHTIKVWDLRKATEPVQVTRKLIEIHVFSPRNRIKLGHKRIKFVDIFYEFKISEILICVLEAYFL